MMRRLAAFAVLTATIAPSLSAQDTDQYLTAMEYSVAIPVGRGPAFGRGGSWSGAAWEGRWLNHSHTSLGMLIGFNEFYHRQSGTFDFPSGAATGDQYHHLLIAPALVTAAWYPMSNPDDPRWYVGGGAGVQYIDQYFQIGLDQHSRKNWNVVLVPEIGLAFAAWYGTGGIVSLRYHLPSESGAFLGSAKQRFQYVSLSVGFGYR